ncbi:response regulator (plasmid) [Pedobacter sp. BS3]|uniref:hybrid sensor histidine kinase/response regulator transcription factor n=1 Tax=Pedobacter sp. BS3 TaxID=2567937 RepID=UPI0011EDB2B2|nr:hybrid sensor histidine kinase/response regulator transcription factor [Pedobacter sp. BS3]TZF86280.1 response regulator [Pedobacter sp. BS3]
MRWFKYLLCICFTGICAVSAAQHYPLKFKHISYEQGLSQSPIGALFQDKKGFIWVGNREGLSRYDGYEFITYKHREGDANSLSHNLVRAIYQDSKGIFWIGTSNGLNRFNPSTEKFTYLDISDKQPVVALLEDKRQHLWIASYRGLKQINLNKNRNEAINWSGNEDILKSGRIRALLLDKRGKIWVGLESGVKCIDPVNGKLLTLPDAMKNNATLLNAKIAAIHEDKAGDLWFASEDKGLFWYQSAANQCHNFRHSINTANSIPSDVIKDLLVYDEEHIWLGTRMGLSVFNKENLTFTNYQHIGGDVNSLSQNSVWNFLRDRSGNIWMGTYAGGLNVYYPGFNNFDNIGEKVGDNVGLSQPIVNAILEDPNGALWVATDGGGINYLNRATKQSRYIPLVDKSRQHSSNIVKVMARDNHGKFYVGTLEGLGIFTPSDGSVRYLPIDQEYPMVNRRVNTLIADGDLVWAGMHTTGLWLIRADGTTTSFKHDPKNIYTLSSNCIHALYRDGKQGIWIGTQNGLNFYSRQTNNITRYQAFDQQVILAVFKDSENRLWVGTETGLNLFDPETGKRQLINDQNGLINNVIESITEDNSGHIWVSTQRGISKINHAGTTFSIHNYTSNDGLSSNQFLPGAVFKTAGGELLFGGVNGLTTFYPEKIIKNEYQPHVVFTDFLIHNKPVTCRTKDSPLTLPIDDTKKLTLNYQQASIAFKVAALNYINSSKNQYAYKLEGFDKNDEWHYAGDQRIINYTNLPAGNYTFRVKASNNDGIWNETGRSIAITILPPFWKTTWAYIGYFLLFAGLLYLFNYYSVKTERLRHQLELESLSHVKDQELAQRKMTFFTNISHEIKTPLTMILAPIERLLGMSDGDHKVQHQLALMHRNGQRLMRLINQLLDFRRFDSGSEALQATEGDIVRFSKEVFLAFKGLAEQKRISLNFHAEMPELPVWFDGDKLEKVLYNLLSNAVKFTPYEGSITFSIRQTGDCATLTVEDNGCGISASHIENIFEQFKFYNENGQNEEGSGVGLAFSKSLVKLHHGEITVESRQATSEKPGYTAFTVTLPLGKAHLAANELSGTITDEERVEDYQPLSSTGRQQFSQRKQEILAGLEKEKPSLLLVEDNPEVLDFMVSGFSDEFEVHTAVNGELGIQQAANLVPDIIISDVMMPVMDGIALCGRLKSDIRTSHIPVILLTARSSLVFKIEGFETGADDYITKPFAFSILNARVWNLLDSRQKLRERYKKEIRLEPQNIVLSSADDKLLMDLMSYIEQHLDNPDLTVDELSREVAVGRATLYKKIKALTGQTVNDFVRSIRLKRAAQLLEQGKHTISEVAYIVGFSDINYFRKCFKEQFGFTPKEYSKQSK